MSRFMLPLLGFLVLFAQHKTRASQTQDASESGKRRRQTSRLGEDRGGQRQPGNRTGWPPLPQTPFWLKAEESCHAAASVRRWEEEDEGNWKAEAKWIAEIQSECVRDRADDKWSLRC